MIIFSFYEKEMDCLCSDYRLDYRCGVAVCPGADFRTHANLAFDNATIDCHCDSPLAERSDISIVFWYSCRHIYNESV